MQHLREALSTIPATLKALNDNPLGAVVLVTLAALVFAAYVLHKGK